jgi:hypothetical protein
MSAIREFAQQLKDRQKWPQAYVYQQFFATLGNGTAQGWQGVRDLRELGELAFELTCGSYL